MLVLDNFEQVVAAAGQLSGLLCTCPHLKILVTSRIPINLSGEFVHMVRPLALPRGEHSPKIEHIGGVDAVRLFVERARSRSSDYALTTENAPEIARICNHLGGIPLAIEMAAARVGALPVSTILTRLDHSLTLLTGGPQDAPARQRTMRDMIAWSHDLLHQPEQALFRRLGVFVNGFTLEAAEAITGQVGMDVLEGVAALAANSLLNSTVSVLHEPRFVMLDIVREFALERLTGSGELEAVRDVHASFFMNFAEAAIPSYDGPELALQIGRVNADLDNARAALRWTLESGNRETGVRLAGALWRDDCPQIVGKEWFAHVSSVPHCHWVMKGTLRVPFITPPMGNQVAVEEGESVRQKHWKDSLLSNL